MGSIISCAEFNIVHENHVLQQCSKFETRGGRGTPTDFTRGCSAQGPDPFNTPFHIPFPEKVPFSHTSNLKKGPFPIPVADKGIPFGRSIPV